MTIESNFWSTVHANLSPYGALKRIENSADKGTGDVAYCLTRPKPGSLAASGWLELKVAEWPAKPLTPIRPRHLTKDQVLFAEEWSDAGGRAWLILRATPWYLLFDPAGIRGLYEGRVCARDAPAVAKAASIGRFPTGPVLKALTSV